MRHGSVLWGRYVLEIVSGDIGVQVRCANGYVEQASVLVGADGAHSAVRQNLYRKLKDKGLLPKCDAEAPKFTQNALIGLTNTLDPSQYPDVNDAFSKVNMVIARHPPYTVSSFVLIIVQHPVCYVLYLILVHIFFFTAPTHSSIRRQDQLERRRAHVD
jgi:hypothetical protein